MVGERVYLRWDAQRRPVWQNRVSAGQEAGGPVHVSLVGFVKKRTSFKV